MLRSGIQADLIDHSGGGLTNGCFVTLANLPNAVGLRRRVRLALPTLSRLCAPPLSCQVSTTEGLARLGVLLTGPRVEPVIGVTLALVIPTWLTMHWIPRRDAPSRPFASCHAAEPASREVSPADQYSQE